MKNYYEILEVDEKASQEVIDKAYRVLAKKYHPDLQEDKNKKIAEEKIKSLNEAYEILSKPEKRKSYDAKRQIEKENEERKKQAQQQNYVNNISSVYANQYANIQRQTEKDKQANRILKREYKKELRRLRIKGFLKKIIATVSVFIVLFIICFIIYQIPLVKNWIYSLYEDNFIIKAIVDAIS